MTRKAVDRIRAGSKASNNGPWVQHYAEMARKTVIKNLMKYIPKSIEVAKATSLDNAQETGDYSLMEFDTPDALPMPEAEPEASPTVSKVSGKIKALELTSSLDDFNLSEQELTDFRTLAESNGADLELVASVTNPKTAEALEAAILGGEA